VRREHGMRGMTGSFRQDDHPGLSRVSVLPTTRPQNRGQSQTAGQSPVAGQDGSKVKPVRARYEIQEAGAKKPARCNILATNLLCLPSPSLPRPETKKAPEFRTGSYPLVPVRTAPVDAQLLLGQDDNGNLRAETAPQDSARHVLCGPSCVKTGPGTVEDRRCFVPKAIVCHLVLFRFSGRCGNLVIQIVFKNLDTSHGERTRQAATQELHS
jgi:hypothetical protein